jgi:hypothetical protein
VQPTAVIRIELRCTPDLPLCDASTLPARATAPEGPTLAGRRRARSWTHPFTVSQGNQCPAEFHDASHNARPDCTGFDPTPTAQAPELSRPPGPWLGFRARDTRPRVSASIARTRSAPIAYPDCSAARKGFARYGAKARERRAAPRAHCRLHPRPRIDRRRVYEWGSAGGEAQAFDEIG